VTRATRLDPGPALVTAAAATGAVALGLLVAHELTLGAGLACTLVLAGLAIRYPAVAVALWIPSFFLSFLPGANQLLQIGFPVAALAAGVAHLRGVSLRQHRMLFGTMLVLAAWATASLQWAASPEAAASELWKAGLAMAVALAIVWVVASERDALWVIAALAGGAVASAALGLVGGETIGAYRGGQLASDRLAGGSGDANQLAAGLVAAIALLLGLTVALRSRAGRLVAGAGIVVAGIGLAASQSRGGLIAAAIMVVLALVLMPGARVRTLAWVGGAAAGLAVYFAATPSALERVTAIDEEGTGRADLWRIGWRMVVDHPMGVGLDNFRLTSAEYALSPGAIERPAHIVDTPVVAHNTFLQVLAELGIVGLVAYLAVVAVSSTAFVRAARRFAATGRPHLAVLARASLVALLAFLASSLFVSFAFSYRMWALLALGPALLTVALRDASGSRAPATR
jgi:O-antigen ligase